MKGKLPPGLAKYQASKKAGVPATTSDTADTMMPAPVNPMNAGSHAARESSLAAAMVAKHKKTMGY